MSNLIPVKRLDKNGRMVTRHVTISGPATAGGSNLPEPAPAVEERPRRTFAGTVRELENLGISINRYKPRKDAVRMLAKHAPEMLERIMDAIATADAPTRERWGRQIENEANNAFRHNSAGGERMLANTDLTARLASAIGSDILQSPHLFRTDNLAIDIEEVTGIAPGDPRYNEVQAAIIYCGITNPAQVSRTNTDLSYLDTHRDDIMTIANNMDRVFEILPELCKRRDASRHAIHALGDTDAPSLISGML